MAATSALIMVCVGGIEVTKILWEVREDGWVAAAPRGAEPPFWSRPRRLRSSNRGLGHSVEEGSGSACGSGMRRRVDVH
jgi:hypothetical protein